MFDEAKKLIDAATKVVIVQAENPDGDSLGSSLALEEILSDLGKEVTMFCAIDIPKYMHYINGWDRVVSDWPRDADLAIIVDTATKTLLVKTFELTGVMSFLESHPVLVLDHHDGVESDFPFDHAFIADGKAVATAETIHEMAVANNWPINQQAAESMLVAVLSDSLGLTTPSVTAESYRVAASLVALGAVPHEIENRRREYMKKPADILTYKGRLLERIEYSLDGKLATVHIPWEEIQEYSDRYNPSVLVLDEMRLVEGVEIAVAIKTYPDGKATGKIRSNAPVAQEVSGFFGGGGHEHSAGFKVYEEYDKIMSELVTATDKALKDYYGRQTL